MPAPVPAAELILAGRAWRLAILTTGDADVARRALASLPPPVPGEALDADKIDRLAIQALRRAAGPQPRLPAGADTAPAPTPRPAREPISYGPAHAVLTSLPLQAAEAFVLRRLDDLDPIRACRAMDCSRSAAERFLARADQELAARLAPDPTAAIAALRATTDSLAPDPQVVALCMTRARDRHRRRIALAITIIAATLTTLLILATLTT